MFSKRLRLIFGYRLKYSELLFLTPYYWNLKSQTLSLSSRWRYFAWPSVHLYMTLYELVTFLRIIVYVWIWKDVVDFDKVSFAADILYVIITSAVLAFMFLSLLKRQDGLQLTNLVLGLDDHFEEMYQSSYSTAKPSKEKLMKLLSYSINLESIKSNVHHIRNKFFPGYDPFGILMESMLILTSVVSCIAPFIFPIATVIEEREPMHRFLVDFFNIKPKFQLQFVPLLLQIFFMISHVCNALCFHVNNGILYCQLLNGWLDYFATNDKVRIAASPANFWINETVIKSKAKNDEPVICNYRKLQMMHKVANKIYGSPLFGYHHACTFTISIVVLYALMRWYNEFSLMIYLCLVVIAAIVLIVPLFEFMALSSLREKSELLVKQMKMRNPRNSFVGKVVKSLWLVKLDAGLPFYTVAHDTILTYMERLTGFLIDVLMSLP